MSETPAQQPPTSEPRSKDLGEEISRHVTRAVGWRVRMVEPTPDELAVLEAAGVADPTMRRYLCWRRSALYAITPLIGVASILAAISFKDVDTEIFNGLGVLFQVLPLLAVFVLLITTIAAARSWQSPHQSHRVLMAGWLVSFVVPLVTAVLPIEWLLDVPEGTDLSGVRILTAVLYGITLLPIIATFPSGVVRGSLRAKGLLPAASLPGLFLVAAAPFYALILLIMLSVIDQLAGNVLLVLGVGALAFAPCWFIVRRDYLTRPILTPEDEQELEQTQRVAGLLVLGGAFLVIIWAFTAEIELGAASFAIVGTGDEALFSPSWGSLTVVELLARWMITTVLFTHVFLTVAARQWRHEQVLRESAAAAQHDSQMAWTEWVTRPTTGP